MSYRIFLNLGEILQGDMVGKLGEGIGSKDFKIINATLAPQKN